MDPDRTGGGWGSPAERTQNVDGVGRTQPPRFVVDSDPRSRALAIWPGLDRRKLTRTCGDPHRIARLVEGRTALPLESILRLLGVRQIEERIHGKSGVHTSARPIPSRLQAPAKACRRLCHRGGT